MNHYFNSRDWKERRLLGFADQPKKKPEPQSTPEQAPQGEPTTKEEAQKQLDQVKKNLDKAKKPGEAANTGAKKAADQAKQTATEDADKNIQETVKKKADAATLALKEALSAVVQEGQKPTQEQIKTAMEESVLSNSYYQQEGYEISVVIDKDGNPSVEYKEIDEGIISDETVESFAEAMRELGELIRKLIDGFSEGLNLGGGDDDKEKQKPKPGDDPENKDKKPGEGNEDGTDDDSAETGGDKNKKKPEEGGGETSPEGLTSEQTEHPQQAIEDLDSREAKLEAELKGLVGEDGNIETSESGRAAEITAEIAQIHKQREALQNVIDTRKQNVEKAWKEATANFPEAERLVKSVTCENGDSLVITLEPSIEDKDKAIKSLEDQGFKKQEDGTYVFESPKGQIFDDVNQFKPILDKLAAMKINPQGKPKDNPDTGGGDLLGGGKIEDNESKEVSPEVLNKLKELNEQLDKMCEANKEFMNETPIGAIFQNADYKIGTSGEIVMTIPEGAMAQLENIVTSNGRQVDEDGNVTGYAGGGSFNIGSGEYPSRFGWGGPEGADKEARLGQAEAASTGMTRWAEAIAAKVPDDTEAIDAGEPKELTEDAEENKNENTEKVETAVKELQGSIGPEADKTALGQYLNSLNVSSVDGKVAVTGKGLDKATFSHFHNLLKVGGEVSINAAGEYTVQLNEGTEQSYIDAIGRIKAFIGSAVGAESPDKPNDGGDFGGGEEPGEKGEEGEKGEPGEQAEQKEEPQERLLTEKELHTIESNMDAMINRIGTEKNRITDQNDLLRARNGLWVEEVDGGYQVKVDKSLLDFAKVNKEQVNLLTEGMTNNTIRYETPVMNADELERFQNSFMNRIVNYLA